MKKIIFILIWLAFSVITNAQILEVFNNNTGIDVNVQGIVKLTNTCQSTTYCGMPDMFVADNSSVTDNMPLNCGSTFNILLTVTNANNVNETTTILYCGTPVTNIPWGGSYHYDVYVSGPNLVVELKP